MGTTGDSTRQGEWLQRIDDLPPTVSIEEAARLCGVSRSAAYRAVHRGELTAFRLGRKLRVPTLPLLRLLGIEQDVAETV